MAYMVELELRGSRNTDWDRVEIVDATNPVEALMMAAQRSLVDPAAVSSCRITEVES